MINSHHLKKSFKNIASENLSNYILVAKIHRHMPPDLLSWKVNYFRKLENGKLCWKEKPWTHDFYSNVIWSCFIKVQPWNGYVKKNIWIDEMKAGAKKRGWRVDTDTRGQLMEVWYKRNYGSAMRHFTLTETSMSNVT